MRGENIIMQRIGVVIVSESLPLYGKPAFVFVCIPSPHCSSMIVGAPVPLCRFIASSSPLSALLDPDGNFVCLHAQLSVKGSNVLKLVIQNRLR